MSNEQKMVSVPRAAAELILLAGKGSLAWAVAAHEIREALAAKQHQGGQVAANEQKMVSVPREQLAEAAHRLSDLGQAHISEPLFGLIHAQDAQHQDEPEVKP